LADDVDRLAVHGPSQIESENGAGRACSDGAKATGAEGGLTDRRAGPGGGKTDQACGAGGAALGNDHSVVVAGNRKTRVATTRAVLGRCGAMRRKVRVARNNNHIADIDLAVAAVGDLAEAIPDQDVAAAGRNRAARVFAQDDVGVAGHAEAYPFGVGRLPV